MKTELGKWLMDIAKYIATAVVLTTIFGEIGSKVTLAVLGGATVLLTLIGGLFLIYIDKDDKKSN
jgi:hypothetical protein